MSDREYERLKQLRKDEAEDDDDEGDRKDEEYEQSRFDALYDTFSQYNEEIYRNKQEGLESRLPNKDEGFDISGFELNTDKIGCVKLHRKRKKRLRNKEYEKDLVLPIYLMPTSSNVKNGFVPLRYTSVPIGGENTLSVLYGSPKEDLGNEKFNVKIGDRVTIENYWDTLEYIVTEVFLLKSDDIESFKIQDGRDEVELLIAEHNKKIRYCALCSRVKKDVKDDDDAQETEPQDAE